MDHNECNTQLRATLYGLFGLEDSDSLHGNEDSYGGYTEGPDRYLDTDDKDLQNLDGEEMNRSHQSTEDEDLSVFDSKEDHYWEDDVEEEKGPMHDDSYTEEHYTAGPVKARNQSKRIDCIARVNCQMMNDGSCIVIKVILEHNHELEPAMSHFCPSHRELSKTVKRSLVTHDITSLRPSKSIRLLEVEAGGLEIMRTWLMAMGEIPLTTILTDQCESIKAAIHEVMPNTVHRYCIWHIFTKLLAMLRGLTNYKPAKARFKAIIFDSIKVSEFEDKWKAFVEEYDLG
ncbi:hypothetical protein BC332_23987 [Capsicum chinense]|nr:hypothetical protein BC332_23987 [Capsicum chinense]